MADTRTTHRRHHLKHRRRPRVSPRRHTNTRHPSLLLSATGGVVIWGRMPTWWPWHAIAETDFGLGIDMGAYHTKAGAERRATEDCPDGWTWRVIHRDDLTRHGHRRPQQDTDQ